MDLMTAMPKKSQRDLRWSKTKHLDVPAMQHSAQGRLLLKRCDAIRRKAESLWAWFPEIESASTEVGMDLEIFQAELDASPIFSKMPAYEDECDYLWAMFLMWGEPGTDIWDDKSMNGSALNGLPVEAFFLALAWKAAANATEPHFDHLLRPVATKQWLIAVKRYVRTAEKALAFAEECLLGISAKPASNKH
jgi:hypothetical protein